MHSEGWYVPRVDLALRCEEFVGYSDIALTQPFVVCAVAQVALFPGHLVALVHLIALRRGPALAVASGPAHQ